MKKLLLLLLFIPLLSFSQDNIERYKLYPTDTMFIFIKLDTAEGKLWLVQWSLDTSVRDRITTLLSDTNWAEYYDEQPNGRFELYPTTNFYNFIMLDTIDGDAFQVQWSVIPENNFVIPFPI